MMTEPSDDAEALKRYWAAAWCKLQFLATEPSDAPCAILPFPVSRCRFRREAVIRLWAADDGLERYPLPDRPIETEDGRFRLTVTRSGQVIELGVQAIGLAIDPFANRYIGIAKGDDLDSVWAVVRLDALGAGCAVVGDDETNRRALAKIILGSLEEDDA